MKIKVFGRTFSIEKKDKDNSPSFDISRHVSEREFSEYVDGLMNETGKTEAEILGEIFQDGWLTVMVEEGGGTAKIDASQLYREKNQKEDSIGEYIRLRNKFSPISSCVDYIKDQILGGGIGIQISNPSDKIQKDFKLELERLLENIYQDEYTRSLHILLPILVDDALTTGCAASEIVYSKTKTFWDYATVSNESQTVKVKGTRGQDTEAEIVIYKTREPNWSNDLKGITRLKIMTDAYKRFSPQRNPISWEINYWILDEGKSAEMITLSSGIKVRKSLNEVNGTYFHPWQIFWLTLRRKGFDVKGESIIKPVFGSALLLEKIYKAVGEGIHRAGNKKYFIVCGTKERPWSGPHIRNVLQQLKQAQKRNWSTIPMPEGFDIKDIGGEVFEAKDVVDYFLKSIASGMKVPSDVLGVEVKEQKKYSHEEYKLNLMSAIKHQLFKRHIWCLHGKTKTKQGGKVTDPTYIPNPRFMVENLLGIKDQIDLFKTLLNPANPIRPEVKLEVERSICKIMGWDSVLLPSQEEYRKQLKEEEELMKQQMKAKPKTSFDKKKQGEPVPQTVERQKKRLAGMTEKHPEKGKSRKLGGTRVPKEVQESVPEPKSQKVDVNITVKSEPQKVKVEVEPQELKISLDTTKLDKLMNNLVENQKELIKKEDLLIVKRGLFEEGESKGKQKKLQKEIEKLEAEVERSKKECTEITTRINLLQKESSAKIGTLRAKTLIEMNENRETEKVKRGEIEKTAKREREEITKTGKEKRKAIDEIGKKIK